MEVDPDPTNRNYRRLVWTGVDTCHWEGLKQPDGIRTFSERSLETLERPLSATATFDENGVVGKLDSGGFSETGDLIIAGMGQDRMSLTVDSAGQFQGTPDDVLAIGDFLGQSLVSDQQRRRASVYASMFENTEKIDAFKPLLLYEAKVLRLLESSTLGIPKILYAGQEGQYNLIVTELLGPSLFDLQKYVGRQFTMQTTVMLAIETIKLLKHVHDKGFLHRDLKPANICVG